MEIKNKTLYDKNLILSYNNYYLTSYIQRNFIVITAISAVFIIYMMVIQAWWYALLLFGILIFYLILTYFMQKLTTKRILKKSPLVEQPVLQTYIFRDDNFDVSNIKTMTVRYEEILKYKAGKEFYLLQSRDRKTYIVDYKGFENEVDFKTFGNFLKEKYAKKKRV